MKHHMSGGTASVDQSFRLPKTVKPSNYKISLTPDLTKFTFAGAVEIDVDVLEATSTVKINAKELVITAFSATNSTGTRLNGKISLDEETEIATISFDGTLGKGAWKLSAVFTGTLNDKLKGFYRSIWTDEQGKKHTIATTQFESTDARRAFPCFDEPEFKATFDVTLTVPEELTALSNGAIIKSEAVGNGLKAVSYERTMKMSTYLVCFCIGEFVSSKPVMVNGIETRVWCVPGKVDMTEFALRAAAFATDHYEKYFEIPYPGGKKIDHIAIPDFASGAMENLGLITYRETALLLNEKTATHAERTRVAVVVLHELAHMWFGDLVTMSWWNGLWLNESFATFMENLCLDAWQPTWNVWDEFGLSRAAASRVDALRSTHPIECAVNHPDEAAQLFDVISYEKGCSVLYQIHQYIGAETFRRGIAIYLKRHSYSNTETHDLWDALEEACKAAAIESGNADPVPVREIMDAWVFTAGHPVVEVKGANGSKNSNDSKNSHDTGSIELTQRPFKFLSETADATLWPIPVTLRAKIVSKSGKSELIERKFLMSEKSHIEKLGDHPGAAPGAKIEWVVVNSGGSGFYRVVYDKALTAALSASANASNNMMENSTHRMSAIERFNLVNDAWACVRSGILPTPDYIEMVKLFDAEEDPNVWAIITSSLSHLHSLVKDDHRKALAEMVRKLVKPTVDRLGYAVTNSDESVQSRQLRGSLIGVLGTIGEDADVQKKAVELFSNWKADNQSVDSNVVPALVSILAHNGDEARYDEFFKLSKAAQSPQEVQRFLFALARFRDSALLNKTISKCLTDDVRTQDAPYLYANVLGNEIAAAPAWNFMKANWADMVARYPENGVVRMCGAVSGLDTAELEAEVKAFFAANQVKSGDMAVAQALEQLRINVLMRERETAGLQKHLIAISATANAAEAASAVKADEKQEPVSVKS